MKKIVFVVMMLLLNLPLLAAELSRSFELRYFTPDARANGETDFKGETEYFDTEQRVEFLRQYAEYAKLFFKNPGLDQLAVPEDQVQSALAKLKSQPMTRVRRSVPLNSCSWLGYRPGQREQDQADIEKWAANPMVRIESGRLIFQQAGELKKSFEPQDWRFFLQWRAKIANPQDKASFRLIDPTGGSAVSVDFNAMIKGNSRDWHEFKIEGDLVEKRYNLYVDGKKVVDFSLIQNEQIKAIDSFMIEGCARLEMDDIWGVGYHPTGVVAQPFTAQTFIDADVEVKPAIDGWQNIDYDDSLWAHDDLPIMHGGERYAKEDLYLRKVIEVGEYDRAVLEAETIDPAGEIWINGHVVSVTRDRHPLRIDITDDLRKNSKNIIAVRVRYFENNPADFPHSPADPYIGWFAGRMKLDFRKSDYIDDVFVYTTQVNAGKTADEAVLQAEITLANEHKEDRFQGSVAVNLYPWFPEESGEIAATVTVPVTVTEWCRETIKPTIQVPGAKLWTFDNPQLYKVEVVLRDKDGQPVDDYVFTTGIRKISQDGGVLKINDKVETLNGAGIFQFLYPMDKIAAWNRCAPLDWLVRQALMVRNMGGNAMRIHVHAWAHEPPARNINDPRLAEVGDQLGLMFQWGTTAWIRSGTPWGVDFEGYKAYIRQVRNHPSIVIWEGSNHPTVGQKYDRKPDGWLKFLNKIHETIYSQDPSRLIIPIARFAQISKGAHDWTAPNVAWGNMDCQLGNKSQWTHLRKWPNSDQWPRDFSAKRLNDPNRAYICTEHQEAIGQINWPLSRGKPWYKVHSYEWDTDEAVIGRRLTLDEWQLSQAWQAMTVYEPIKKMRWLDYDGFFWCCLRGGPNMATYMKPLIDYMGYAKLSWYAHRMVFQNILAGSGDVDVVYGPGDAINPIVLNHGSQWKADVTIQIKKPADGAILAERKYPAVSLEGGRTVTRLEPWRPADIAQGYCVVEYSVAEAP
jgi:hypothetical protein